jgi:hypothetical protein
MYRDATPGLGDYQFSAARFSGRQNLERGPKVTPGSYRNAATAPRGIFFLEDAGTDPRSNFFPYVCYRTEGGFVT